LGESIEGDLPCDMEVQENKLRLSFGVQERDFNAFARVLRQNGVPYEVSPHGQVDMRPSDTEVVYVEDGDGYDEDERTD
jgi:hypothetical protein